MALTRDALLKDLSLIDNPLIEAYLDRYHDDIIALLSTEADSLALLSDTASNDTQHKNAYHLLFHMLHGEIQQLSQQKASQREVNDFFVRRLSLHRTLFSYDFTQLKDLIESDVSHGAAKLFIRAYLIFEIRKRLGTTEKNIPNDFNVPLAVYEFIRDHAQACLEMQAVPPLIQTLFDRYIIYCRTHPGFVEAYKISDELLAQKEIFQERLAWLAGAEAGSKTAADLHQRLQRRIEDNGIKNIFILCEALPELKKYIDDHYADYWQNSLETVFTQHGRYIPIALSNGADTAYEVLRSHFGLTLGEPNLASPLVGPNPKCFNALRSQVRFFMDRYTYEPETPLPDDSIFPLMANLVELSAGGIVYALQCLYFLLYTTHRHYEQARLNIPTYRTQVANLVYLTFAGVKSLIHACQDNPSDAANSLRNLAGRDGTLANYFGVLTHGAAHTVFDSVILLLNFCRHSLLSAAAYTNEEAIRLEAAFALDLSALPY